MLALARYPGQSVVLEGIGTVKVIRISGIRVRLELNMPNLDIFRDNIVNRRNAGTHKGALLLDRFPGQSLEVCRAGHTVGTVYVSRVHCGQVRLGFDFPQVTIKRKELIHEARISDAGPSVQAETRREGVVGQ